MGAVKRNGRTPSGVLELTGTVGLFYMLPICLGLPLVMLKNLQFQNAPPLAPSPHAALQQALLPFDSGR
jgi:hypothetical protein